MKEFLGKYGLEISIFGSFGTLLSGAFAIVNYFQEAVGIARVLFFSSLIFGVLSIIFFILYRENKRQLGKSRIEIEGLVINGLNQSNNIKVDSKGASLIEATYGFDIVGSDSHAYIEHKARFKEDRNDFPFRASADIFNSFNEMVCYGFDLREDPAKTIKIPAQLAKSDGSLKKINVPFIKPVLKGDLAHAALFRITRGCMSKSKDYLSIMPCSKGAKILLKVKLSFTRIKPSIVNKYEVDAHGKHRKLGQAVLERKGGKVLIEEEYPAFDPSKSLVYIYTV